jgi:hypothetical protein
MHYVEMSVLQKLLALLILKSAPQDLPYSPLLMLQLVGIYILSGFVVLQTTLNPDDLFFGLLLGLLTQYVFVYFVLRALHRSERFVQTFCAIIGAGILFNLLSWPVFSMFSDDNIGETLKPAMSLVFLLIISWEVLVKAHIFKHSLEMKMFSALALSFSLFFISVALSQLLFPVEAAG